MTTASRFSPQRLSLALGLSAALLSPPALAAEPKSCQNVRFSNVDWTGITATTAVVSEILMGLGYKPSTQLLSVPVTYSSMKSKRIDVFLGTWMPSMESDIKPYTDDGSVETLAANLEGAKYTLAVPNYVADAGVKSFADLAKHADKFKKSIHGLERGNDGNRLILDMIGQNAFDLKDFKLVKSSEAGMVSLLARSNAHREWVVFLGWAPHPMNTQFNITYLSGGDDFFGPNYGAATVYTNVRQGYTIECANVGELLKNIQFNLTLLNTLLSNIIFKKQKPETAAKAWIKSNPAVLKNWLKGVKTFDGKEPNMAEFNR